MDAFGHSEDDSMDSFHNPDYYRDEARCLVPSCKKYRRDNPQMKFFGVPSSLKENWCQALLNKAPPKRSLFVCEDHINIEQDCYTSKRGKLHLKSTANLTITRTWNEEAPPSKKPKISESQWNIKQSVMYQSTHSENAEFTTSDVTAGCSPKIHKEVLAKPSLRSVGINTSITVNEVDKKVMPTHEGSFSAATSGTSTPSLYQPSTSSSSSPKDIKDLSGRNHVLKMIECNPKMYIGIPKKFSWIVDLISKECKLNRLHVIITLFKIKQNDSLKRISDHFELTEVTILNIIKKCMTVIATYLQNFIYLPSTIQIKSMLPPVFKMRYANVQCIIDCFEIEIEKPLDPVKQAQTWSNYKSCNTIKYLIGSCPNGLICFISEGYGGRISDKAITECSGFVDILPPNAVILADRGFKGITSLLKDKNIQLIHPPSVSANETPTKEEVIKSKVVASLRVHIERVIRRIRDFYFLKPHSVVNHKHVCYLDEAVIIACALSNLQDEIIKIE